MTNAHHPDDKRRAIADAAALFHDEPDRPLKSAGRPKPETAAQGYDLAGGEPEVAEDQPAPVPVPAPPPRPEKTTQRREKARIEDEEAPAVDEVWTRWGEWGPSLLWLGGAGLA